MAIDVGAFAFGLVIGWFTYFVNRYRKGVALRDVGLLIGALAGAAVLALFPSGTELFAWYGIGLAAGFFVYFLVLVLFVLLSKDWSLAWFLDGRRPPLAAGQVAGRPDDHPMLGARPPRGD